MKSCQHERTVNAPVAKILEAYRDDTFYIEKLKNSGALTVEILEREDLGGGKLRKKARVTEPSRVPAFLRKADVEGYVDDNVLDPGAKVMTYTIIPDTMPDRVHLGGKVEFHDAGDKTRMVFRTEVEVKIPLVGGKAEGVAIDKAAEEVDRQVAFINRWIAEH